MSKMKREIKNLENAEWRESNIQWKHAFKCYAFGQVAANKSWTEDKIYNLLKRGASS